MIGNQKSIGINQMRKFMALPVQEKKLYGSVTLWLLIIKLSLFLIPFGRLVVWLNWLNQHKSRPKDAQEIETVVQAIERSSRLLPWWQINCLPQALVGHMLLRRRGFNVQLKIGVCKNFDKKLSAHAWLEYGGRVVLGDGRDLKSFTAFPIKPFFNHESSKPTGLIAD